MSEGLRIATFANRTYIDSKRMLTVTELLETPL